MQCCVVGSGARWRSVGLCMVLDHTQWVGSEWCGVHGRESGKQGGVWLCGLGSGFGQTKMS